MTDKTYVITGASSGIGKALLAKLAQNNTVYIGCRDMDKAKALQELYTGNVFPFYVDYSQPETIKPAVEFILSRCDKIDTLVNIAGCVVAGPVENIDVNEIRRQFDVNVFGHLELTQGLINSLSGGKIINVSSMASYGIFPFISPYCASKRCLDMFFNSLLIENKKGIKVISIKPGVIATPLWGKSIEENSKFFDKYKEYSSEMQFVLNNAKRNEMKGLSVEKVVDVILKADSVSKPKLSYTVGTDAYMARLISKLPQGLINNIIKFGIKCRIK